MSIPDQNAIIYFPFGGKEYEFCKTLKEKGIVKISTAGAIYQFVGDTDGYLKGKMTAQPTQTLSKIKTLLNPFVLTDLVIYAQGYNNRAGLKLYSHEKGFFGYQEQVGSKLMQDLEGNLGDSFKQIKRIFLWIDYAATSGLAHSMLPKRPQNKSVNLYGNDENNKYYIHAGKNIVSYFMDNKGDKYSCPTFLKVNINNPTGVEAADGSKDAYGVFKALRTVTRQSIADKAMADAREKAEQEKRKRIQDEEKIWAQARINSEKQQQATLLKQNREEEQARQQQAALAAREQQAEQMAVFASQKEESLTEWMSTLKDETKLCEIVMPGSEQVIESEYPDQCENGVRFFDITVKKYQGQLWDKKSNTSLEKTLTYIHDFVGYRETEFVIIRFSVDDKKAILETNAIQEDIAFVREVKNLYIKLYAKTHPEKRVGSNPFITIKYFFGALLELEGNTNIANMELKELRGKVIYLFDGKKIKHNTDSRFGFHKYRKHKNAYIFKQSGLMICGDVHGSLQTDGYEHANHRQINPHLFVYSLKDAGKELEWIAKQQLVDRKKTPNVILYPSINKAVGVAICNLND